MASTTATSIDVNSSAKRAFKYRTCLVHATQTTSSLSTIKGSKSSSLCSGSECLREVAAGHEPRDAREPRDASRGTRSREQRGARRGARQGTAGSET